MPVDTWFINHNVVVYIKEVCKIGSPFKASRKFSSQFGFEE